MVSFKVVHADPGGQELSPGILLHDVASRFIERLEIPSMQTKSMPKQKLTSSVRTFIVGLVKIVFVLARICSSKSSLP